jgi:precorrin-6A/cobalt-precorrin-6A reductase
VIDATHPIAARISDSAAAACPAAGVPLLRLERPGWTERAGDRWTWVADLRQAAALLHSQSQRVLLTTGRQGLQAFAGVRECWFLVRCVEPPEPPLPPRHRLLLDRGPYTVDGELELIDRHGIELVLAKDSGGEMTRAKLDAARERGLPVILVQRPPRPAVPSVASVAEALAWTGAAASMSP